MSRFGGVSCPLRIFSGLRWVASKSLRANLLVSICFSLGLFTVLLGVEEVWVFVEEAVEDPVAEYP